MHITIIGGGPVGMVFALYASKYLAQPLKITLCQSGTQTVENDPRILAINQGSIAMLLELGVSLSDSAAIHTVHVSQKGHFGQTTIRKNDYNLPQLGKVVTYSHLFDSLHTAIQAQGHRITISEGAPAQVVDTTPTGHLIAQNGQSWETDLCVIAEGGTFDTQQKKDWYRDYQQTALLTTVAAEYPTAQCAFERFTANGPIALLPHPNREKAQYGLIWCLAPEEAQVMKNQPLSAFSSHLTAAFGKKMMGQLTALHPAQSFALGANFRTSIHEHHTVYIGNAAQTLHPVSGQGFNLGLRDAIELAQLLRQSTHLPIPSVLKRFQSHRHTDRVLGRTITDLLPRFFNQSPILRHLGGLGMFGLNLCPPARHLVAHMMMFGYRQ